MTYPIPAKQASAEIEIKKSRFISYARGIQSREEGMAWLEELKERYPDARHHCWAYQLGNPSCAANAGMGDDGEPSGTAGKPILNVLQHKGVGDIMITVIRYFGGIKLGAGGLTRAYGQAAQAVMEVLPIEQQVPMVQLKVECDFSHEQTVRHWCSGLEAKVADVVYANFVTMILELPAENFAQLESSLQAHSLNYQLLD